MQLWVLILHPTGPRSFRNMPKICGLSYPGQAPRDVDVILRDVISDLGLRNARQSVETVGQSSPMIAWAIQPS